MKKQKANAVETSSVGAQEAPRKIFYVDKATSNVYHLCMLTIQGTQVVQDEVVAKDIPGIIYGKLAEQLRNQAIRYAK